MLIRVYLCLSVVPVYFLSARRAGPLVALGSVPQRISGRRQLRRWVPVRSRGVRREVAPIGVLRRRPGRRVAGRSMRSWEWHFRSCGLSGKRLGTPPRIGGWARSSAVEHRLHTAGVTGSIPVAPTIRRSEGQQAFSATIQRQDNAWIQNGRYYWSARPFKWVFSALSATSLDPGACPECVGRFSASR
jgi:hypothetical protein